MSKVIVEEPKSVVEEVTRYECDKCSYRGTADEVHGYRLHTDNQHKYQKGHLCEDCAEAGRYATLVEMNDTKVRIGDRIDWSINVGSMLIAFGLGLSVATIGTFLLWQELLIPSLHEATLEDAMLAGSIMSLISGLLYGAVVVAVLSD